MCYYLKHSEVSILDVLSQLLTRYPSGRLNAATFQTSRYFNSVLVATLRFLDRDNFNGKGREEQVGLFICPRRAWSSPRTGIIHERPFKNPTSVLGQGHQT